jgi:hypothetical protein
MGGNQSFFARIEVEMQREATAVEQKAPPRRRRYFLLGASIFFLGIIIYVVQMATKHLVVPWHVPILGTIGVLLMLVSVVQRPGILRIIGLVIFIALAGMEWHVLLIGSKIAPYTGPAHQGEKLPAFTATFADGRPFSQETLQDGTATVLVFFRGHW